MKSLPVLILAALLLPCAAGSPDLNTLRPAPQSAVMTAAKEQLLKAVRCERDGSAVSHFVRRGLTTRVEWRNLVFRQLIFGTVSKDDREKGVSRRMYAQLASDAYRLTDAEGVGPWRSGHCPKFPGFVMIEEIEGELVVSAPELEKFATTPGRCLTRSVGPSPDIGRALAGNL